MKYYQSNFLYSFSRIKFLFIKELIIIGISLISFACTSLREIEIETSLSPQYQIADDVQSLALLNRGMNLRFTNLSSDSLEKIMINQKMKMDTVFRDSMACDTMIHIAAQALFNSGRFDVVIPREYIVNRNDSGDILTPLDINSVQRICKLYNVDGVLVLEGFNEQLSTNYDYRVLEEGGGFEGSTDINYKSDWRLYRPDNNKVAIRFQVGDSIFWKSNNLELNSLYLQMPRTKEALIGGGIASGLKMAAYISPAWVKRLRYYFQTGNKDIDAAIPLIKENKWEEAIQIWSKHSSLNSSRIRSKVEFNLALAFEMTGDLDLAIEWVLKSYKSNYSSAADEYLKVLDTSRKARNKESKIRY